LDYIAYDKNVSYNYKISDGKQVYIGSILDMERGWEEHKEASKNGTSEFYKYMREIGVKNLKMECLKEFNYFNR
jgi:hypothetical protein